MKHLIGTAGAVVAVAVCGGVVAGCGSSTRSAPASGTDRPTISLWVSGTASDYQQLAAGVKLALSQAHGDGGKFRINFAGTQVSNDPTRAETDALQNARSTLQDSQASAMVTNLPDAVARPAITLLNEAGISTVALGDDQLRSEACSASSDIYPAGRQTAIVVPDSTPPSAWASTFRSTLHFKPTATAWRAYQGTQSLLSSLNASGVATSNNPPRLDRDALAAALVSGHGGC